jgi:hypothetical protein
MGCRRKNKVLVEGRGRAEPQHFSRTINASRKESGEGNRGLCSWGRTRRKAELRNDRVSLISQLLRRFVLVAKS